jgi:hypothetical protein
MIILPPLAHSDAFLQETHFRRLLRTWLIRLIGLVEEEVCGKLLVLVAGEVGLDNILALEAEAAKLLIC